MSELCPCSSCRRHFRIGEDACPFCGAAAPEAPPRRTLPVGRLTRAAIFASAVATSAVGCQKDPPPPKSPDDAQQIASDDAGVPEESPAVAADAAVPDQPDRIERDHSHSPKPYGAPPARQRLV